MNKFLGVILGALVLAILLNNSTPLSCLSVNQIDINSATLSELDKLTGIGPVYAQRIIDGRPYYSIDDLDRVKGIGPATIEKIKTQGLACVNCSNQTPPAEISQNKNEETTDVVKSGEVGAPPTYPSGIYINEILPNPQGSDETEEYIKLYNSNSFDVDLSGWQLQDKAGTITTYTILTTTKILTNGFLVFKRPDTKIVLNNEGDGINLLSPDGKIVDSVGFTNAPLGQSYSKTASDPLNSEASWTWSGQPLGSLTKTQKSDNNSNIAPENLTAAMGQSLDVANPWPLFFITLAITLVMAGIVLLIKFKLNKHVRA